MRYRATERLYPLTTPRHGCQYRRLVEDAIGDVVAEVYGAGSQREADELAARIARLLNADEERNESKREAEQPPADGGE